jgi:pilus assembly protein Flp/PilA
LLWDEDGQAVVEYGILAALVSIAAVALMATLGDEVKGLFQAVLDALS